LDEQFCQHYYSLGDGNCEALRSAVRSEIRSGTPTLELGDPSEKPVLLFFHGWPDTHALWANQFAAFCGDDGEFACVAPSMMDFNPDVPPAHPADLSWPPQADRLFDAVQEIGLEDITLVGHDFGAIIGSMFVARHPEVVKRVIFLDVANDFNRSYPPLESRIAELDGFQQTAISAFRNGDDAELDAFFDQPLNFPGAPPGVALRDVPQSPPCLSCKVAPNTTIGVGSRTGWMQNQWASEDPAWTSFFDTPYSEFEFAYTPTWPDNVPQLFLYGGEQFFEPQTLTWLDGRGDGSGHQHIGTEHWFFARVNVAETNEAMAEFFEATR